MQTVARNTDRPIPYRLTAAPVRTRWTDPHLWKEAGRTIEGSDAKRDHARKERMTLSDDDSAPLVSSLCVSGMHAPALDVDLVHRLRPRPGSLTVESLPEGRTRLQFEGVVETAADWQAVWDAFLDLGLCDTEREPLGSLTLKVPCRVYASSNPINRHVYIDHELTWGEYSELLEVLQGAGITLGNWVPWALERGQSMLLRPGLTKAALREPSSQRRLLGVCSSDYNQPAAE
jgi:hypothetical protein